MVHLDSHRSILALVYKPLVPIIRHAHVLFFQMLGFPIQPAAAEAVQRKTVEVLDVYEEDHHHAALRVGRALAGDSQTFVIRSHVWIGVGCVKGPCDYIAEGVIAARVV